MTFQFGSQGGHINVAMSLFKGVQNI